MFNYSLVFSDQALPASEPRCRSGEFSTLDDNEYPCTQAQFERFGSFIVREGVLIDIGDKPSPAHDFDVKTCAWILNADKQAAIAAAEYAASVPKIVSKAQAKIALFKAGYLDAIEAAMSKMPREVQIYWQDSSIVERANPIVRQLQALLGLTDKQIDGLFIFAASC